MPEILDYGVIKPSTGDDSGDNATAGFHKLFTDLFDQFASHDHDGSNSANITITNLSKQTQDVTAAGWAADGAEYYQDVTMPSGYEYDNVLMQFKITSGTYSGYNWCPRTEKQGTSQYRIWTNDNTLTFTVKYV